MFKATDITYLIVGCSDPNAVGFLVGILDGALDGMEEGVEVGDELGMPVGGWEGVTVGAVGAREGPADGAAVVGVEVGILLGVAVGPFSKFESKESFVFCLDFNLSMSLFLLESATAMKTIMVTSTTIIVA